MIDIPAIKVKRPLDVESVWLKTSNISVCKSRIYLVIYEAYQRPDAVFAVPVTALRN